MWSTQIRVVFCQFIFDWSHDLLFMRMKQKICAPGWENSIINFHEKGLSNFSMKLWQKSLLPCNNISKSAVLVSFSHTIAHHFQWYFGVIRDSIFISVYKLNHVKSQINKSINFALLIKIAWVTWWPMSSWRDTFNIYHC